MAIRWMPKRKVKCCLFKCPQFEPLPEVSHSISHKSCQQSYRSCLSKCPVHKALPNLLFLRSQLCVCVYPLCFFLYTSLSHTEAGHTQMLQPALHRGWYMGLACILSLHCHTIIMIISLGHLNNLWFAVTIWKVVR